MRHMQDFRVAEAADVADGYADTRRAAAHLDMSPSTLRKWRYERIGPPYDKLGKKLVRYRISALDEWAKTGGHRG